MPRMQSSSGARRRILNRVLVLLDFREFEQCMVSQNLQHSAAPFTTSPITLAAMICPYDLRRLPFACLSWDLKPPPKKLEDDGKGKVFSSEKERPPSPFFSAMTFDWEERHKVDEALALVLVQASENLPTEYILAATDYTNICFRGLETILPQSYAILTRDSKYNLAHNYMNLSHVSNMLEILAKSVLLENQPAWKALLYALGCFSPFVSSSEPASLLDDRQQQAEKHASERLYKCYDTLYTFSDALGVCLKRFLESNQMGNPQIHYKPTTIACPRNSAQQIPLHANQQQQLQNNNDGPQSHNAVHLLPPLCSSPCFSQQETRTASPSLPLLAIFSPEDGSILIHNESASERSCNAFALPEVDLARDATAAAAETTTNPSNPADTPSNCHLIAAARDKDKSEKKTILLFLDMEYCNKSVLEIAVLAKEYNSHFPSTTVTLEISPEITSETHASSTLSPFLPSPPLPEPSFANSTTLLFAQEWIVQRPKDSDEYKTLTKNLTPFWKERFYEPLYSNHRLSISDLMSMSPITAWIEHKKRILSMSAIDSALEELLSQIPSRHCIFLAGYRLATDLEILERDLPRTHAHLQKRLEGISASPLSSPVPFSCISHYPVVDLSSVKLFLQLCVKRLPWNRIRACRPHHRALCDVETCLENFNDLARLLIPILSIPLCAFSSSTTIPHTLSPTSENPVLERAKALRRWNTAILATPSAASTGFASTLDINAPPFLPCFMTRTSP